jgi:hypothetical protein
MGDDLAFHPVLCTARQGLYLSPRDLRTSWLFRVWGRVGVKSLPLGPSFMIESSGIHRGRYHASVNEVEEKGAGVVSE